MDGSKRLRTDGPSLQLQAVQRLIERLDAAKRLENAANDEAQDGLVGELLKLQRQLRGTAAQAILDDAVTDILRQLEAAIETLQAVVDKYTPPDSYRPPAAGSEAYVRDIIAYAHKLSYTTFAPPGFVPGQTALRHFKPPAPQDFQLRSSLLHQFQRDYEARQARAKQAAATEAAPTPAEAALAAPLADVPAAPTASIEELLKTLPPMPPGWKPGDRIPGIGAAAAADVAERAVQPPPKEPVQPEPPSEEEEEEAEVAKPQRPMLSSAFGLALNPEYELAESSSEEESEEESE